MPNVVRVNVAVNVRFICILVVCFDSRCYLVWRVQHLGNNTMCVCLAGKRQNAARKSAKECNLLYTLESKENKWKSLEIILIAGKVQKSKQWQYLLRTAQSKTKPEGKGCEQCQSKEKKDNEIKTFISNTPTAQIKTYRVQIFF